MSRSTVRLESHAAGAADSVTNSAQHSYTFSGLCGEVFAGSADEVAPALRQLEEGVANGLHAAGYVAYEAAGGLDSALATRTNDDDLPLLWFGLYDTRETTEAGGLPARAGYSVSEWRPSIDRVAYEHALGVIRDYIAAGDTYQVNFTLRLLADFAGDEVALYRDLCRAQPTSYCAYLDLGRYAIVSASPELFFSLRDGILTGRPMKGTRPRGRWMEEDELRARELRDAVKDRAENLMILDLMRNDLGRVSVTGTVQVPAMWEVERYLTLWQMTSQVRSRLRPGTTLTELFRATFPCGSVTGAPKVRSMQIIAELETRPRGVYTGCIGYISPGMEACFNVAIRTAVIDRERGVAEYGVGSGVTWDSCARAEYEEWRAKARILAAPEPEFALQEVLLLEADNRFFLLERHLSQLDASSRYFGIPLDSGMLRHELEELRLNRRKGGDSRAVQVVVTVHRDGRYHLATEPAPPSTPTLPASLAKQPVDRGDRLLFHNTNLRSTPQPPQKGRQSIDEVIKHNGDGELTECCDGNLVLVSGGKASTPPLKCGLAPGALRSELLSRGQVEERVLRIEAIGPADQLYRIDSVHRWVVLDLAR